MAGSKVSNLLMKYGFYKAPDDFRVLIAAPDGERDRAKRYQPLLANALRRCHAHGVVSMISYTDLTKLTSDGGSALPSGGIILLAVTGHKGLPLSPEAEKMIARMTESRLPFRMFSMDNPALNWSALDQVGTLVSGAGGIPYRLELPWPDHVQDPFLLGIDLGHPRDERISRVVISLLDRHGILLGSWREVQGRDETIGVEALEQGLRWAVKTARAHSGGASPSFLVLRDGRLNKAESPDTYRDILGPRMSLVEFTKYDNPETFVDAPRKSPAGAGTECRLAGCDCRFVTPISPRLPNDLARTFKVNIPRGCDGMNLGLDTICELLCGLSYAPGLGLAPHALPAPIYWADGIAATGRTNHQFASVSYSEEPGLKC